MAEAVKLRAELRDPQKNKGTGTRVARRLRAQGRIPAIVYGHKQTPQPITLAKEDVLALVKSPSHLAELAIDGQTETVLVREVQWDYLGKEVLHLDFARVSAEEQVEAEVALVLKGEAPGVNEGGQLDQQIHSLTVRCRADAIPDSIRLDLSGLHLGQSLHVRDLSLPAGVTVTADPDQLLIHVVERGVAPEPIAEEEGPSEPERIGRKPEAEEESEGK